MNFADIQKQLNDLPLTFQRPGAPYTQWVDALTALLALYCQGVDGLINQLTFANAQYGWVDTYGATLGIRRRNNEADQVYKTRMQNMLLTWRTNAVVMQNWLANIEMVSGSINENLPAVGYNVLLPATLTLAQIQAIILNLAYVRPAGVPFAALTAAGGTYLNTVNYVGGAPRSTGSYLGGAFNTQALGIGPNTNNVGAILPDLLFTDPTINS